MKKEQLIAAGLIVAAALGLVLFGNRGEAPVNGSAKLKVALKAREAPVVVVTDGRSGAQGEFLSSVKAALAGVKGVRLIHVDRKNVAERQAVAQFPVETPAMIVFGIDGQPVLTAQKVEAEAVRKAVEEGLRKEPMKEHSGHSH